jgi:NAD(P)-dependent dehydrogenase (short-subunit alcohol dehydrogenase family)
MYSLEGKVAIVTGAGRPLGIGRSIALRLAQEGADVVVSDLCNRPKQLPEYCPVADWEQLENVAEEVHALGRRALAVKADVAQSHDVEAMIAKAMESFGRIDILVSNASVEIAGPVLEYPEAAWDVVMAVNTKGCFLCSKSAASQMIGQGQGGKIIIIAAQEAKTGMPYLAAYAASKFALIGFTQALAQELAPHRINVNAVCPGTIDNDLGTERFAREAEAAGVSVEEAKAGIVQARIPLGRVGNAEDVAKVVAWLASPESDYMTGQAINVTGGQEAH